MNTFTNFDAQEIQKFDQVADIWWNPKGEMGTLHTINPLRLRFITQHLAPGKPFRALDVGCGGGILSEALAQAGGQVTGIDLSEASLQAARLHAQRGGLEVDYRAISAEELATEQPASFDVVTCMEMLEHVPDPAAVIAACARAVKPGGRVFFSTINRSLKSLFAVIWVGENILRLLPRGTHTYSKLIRPAELKTWSAAAGLEFERLASLIYNPLTGRFRVADGVEDMNYMAQFLKK